MLPQKERMMVELPLGRLVVVQGSSGAALIQHVARTISSGAASTVQLRIALRRLLLQLRLLQPLRPLPRRVRPIRTWRWRMASDLRRPRAQRARSSLCWKT